MSVSRRNLVVSLASAPWLGPSLAQAQRYPDKPIRLVVPYAAGGGTDGTARLLAKQLQDELKQPFNVVNNGQGGGIDLGSAYVLRTR
jgi:tripartite-type tricarboxylate transporter receptor subunit TctC